VSYLERRDDSSPKASHPLNRIAHPALVAAAVLGLSGTAVAAIGSPVWMATGPPPGHTGGFGEPTCIICHNEFELNAFGGMLSVEGLPEAYEPGGSYPLVVRLETTDMVLGGFQMAMRFASGPLAGDDAGRWEVLNDAVTVTADSIDGCVYAHQAPAGTVMSNPTLATWTLVWHAPEEGGDAVLNAAANSGNGDNSPFGDLIYTFSDTIPAGTGSFGGERVPGIHTGGPSRR
jgi:hypothetical protein